MNEELRISRENVCRGVPVREMGCCEKMNLKFRGRTQNFFEKLVAFIVCKLWRTE